MGGKVTGRQNPRAGLTLSLLVVVGRAEGPRGSEDPSMYQAQKHSHWFPWGLEFPGSLDHSSANGPLAPSFPKQINSLRFGD